MSLTVTVHYSAQARTAAGVAAERLELPAPATIADLLASLAQRHAALGPLMHCPAAEGKPVMMIFVGERQVRLNDPTALRDGDEITLLPPIAGG